MHFVASYHDPKAIETCFRAVLDAAVAGTRCPPNTSGCISTALLDVLAHHGRIRVEISGRNWRQVTILKGPSAGRSTAPNPKGHQVWWVRDKNGARQVVPA